MSGQHACNALMHRWPDKSGESNASNLSDGSDDAYKVHQL